MLHLPEATNGPVGNNADPPIARPFEFELLPNKPLGWLYEYSGLAAAKARHENTIKALMIVDCSCHWYSLCVVQMKYWTDNRWMNAFHLYMFTDLTLPKKNVALAIVCHNDDHMSEKKKKKLTANVVWKKLFQKIYIKH